VGVLDRHIDIGIFSVWYFDWGTVLVPAMLLGCIYFFSLFLARGYCIPRKYVGQKVFNQKVKDHLPVTWILFRLGFWVYFFGRVAVLLNCAYWVGTIWISNYFHLPG